LLGKPSKSESFSLLDRREQAVIALALPLGATKAWLGLAARDSIGGESRSWRGARLSRTRARDLS
jgi:hypothetical protein